MKYTKFLEPWGGAPELGLPGPNNQENVFYTEKHQSPGQDETSETS